MKFGSSGGFSIGSEDHDEMDVGSIVKATAGILQSI